MIGLVFIVLFISSMLFFLYLGDKILLWQIKLFPSEAQTRHKLIEGSVFALLGLLIAFTFSGAHERFEARRALVIAEVNAIESTYLRLDLLPINQRQVLQDDVKQYIKLRLEVYKKLPFLDEAADDIKKSDAVKLKIWHTAVSDCESMANISACMILLPEMTNMIAIANARTIMTQIHPPFVVVVMLVSLALFSSLLLGYGFGIQKRKAWHSVNVLGYIIMISFVIFAVINLEYPRIGLIPVNYFDSVLINLHDDLKK